MPPECEIPRRHVQMLNDEHMLRVAIEPGKGQQQFRIVVPREMVVVEVGIRNDGNMAAAFCINTDRLPCVIGKQRGKLVAGRL